MQQGDVARLTVTGGPSAGRTLLLTASRATIGRHRTNDLVLDDPRVGAVQLEITRLREGRLLVRDAGGSGSTWLGSSRVIEAELGPGAVLRLGDTVIEIASDPLAEPDRGSDETRFGGLIGASPEMREIFAVLERAAPTSRPILVQGDRGTGKEELARAVHARSSRRAGPFVILDATSLPAPLAERALAAAFERARGGTLFLDEVGELPLHLQAELLGVLDRGDAPTLGVLDPAAADVRVIASTCHELRARIDAYQFREDLYQRLADTRVHLPRLGARAADIPLLARHFVEQLTTSSSPLWMTRQALTSLESRSWPGNLRELRNLVLRSAALCSDGLITEGDLVGEGSSSRGAGVERDALDLRGTLAEVTARAVQRVETAYLEVLLRRCGGDLEAASPHAGLPPGELRRRIHQSHAASFHAELSRVPEPERDAEARSSWSPTRLASLEEDELDAWTDGALASVEAPAHPASPSGVETMDLDHAGSVHPCPTLGELCNAARRDGAKSAFDLAFAGAREQLDTTDGEVDEIDVRARPELTPTMRIEAPAALDVAV